MKRSLLLWIMLLTVSMVRGQLYTGGQGDGATMSCVPPKVTTLGSVDITCVSNEIVLSVYAYGTDIQYVWQKLGNNFYEDLVDVPYLKGLGTDTLRILLPDKMRDDGKYRCLVKNSCDADTSDVFVLSLNSPPTIKEHLSTSQHEMFVCANMYPSIDLISNIVSLKNDHHYSWTKLDTVTGTNTPFTDTTSYLKVNLSGAALDAAGFYVVTASNVCGSVSDTVYLPVFRTPEVVWNGVTNGRIATCLGERLTLSATVTGGGSYSYYLENVTYDEILGEWSPVTNDPLTTPEKQKPSVVPGDEGYWRWRADNQCGTSYSDIIYISVEGSPNFSPMTPGTYMFPGDTTVCEGSSIRLYCKASGSATRYYWSKDGQRIVGADTNALVLNNLKESDIGTYICHAYNSCLKTVRSRPIHLSLTLRPRFFRDPYLPKKACVGDTLVLFRAMLDPNHDADSVRWMFNDDLLYDNGHYEACDNKDFYVHNIGSNDLGIYQVAAYNQCGETVSEIVNLFDLSIPVSFQKGVAGYDALLCPGSEQKLSVAVSGSAPIHYKWIFNEHSYDSDTNFVTIKGQSVSEMNKYTVYAYNACGSALDSGWLNVERFDLFKFVGSGEVCDGADPTGVLELQGSDTGLIYTLYREYGVVVKTFKGTGEAVRFENMPAGVYYVTGKNPKTDCEQEMDGRPEIKRLLAPAKANFFVSAYYCPGSTNNGAKLVLTDWEDKVTYTLERKTGATWVPDADRTFTGGVRIYPMGSLKNSPLPGEAQIYSNIDYGRYRVVAKNPRSINACTTTMLLADSIHLLESPSVHTLFALNSDTINCMRMNGTELYKEKTSLEVDRYMKGATYTLYKDGAPDVTREPDKTSPIGWSLIGEGTYQVRIVTKEGCEGFTKNSVRVRDVNAPAYQTLSGSGSLCANLDTETNFKLLTIDGTETGINYDVYQVEPSRLIKSLAGTGSAVSVKVPAVRATYKVVASDPTGLCKTSFEKDYTMLASDFQVSTNPGYIHLDEKGMSTWLHVDITGTYVQPLQVKWDDENYLAKTGLVQLPNAQYYKHYHWPFCPCASQHDYYGTYWQHGYSHGPSCTLLNCPIMYHSYDPAKNGCVYVGTEYKTYDQSGFGVTGAWYDLYFCKEGVNPDANNDYYVNDTTNPYRNRLTIPLNESRTYTVTITDGAGCSHADQVEVDILGGKLRADIMYSEVHRHYPYPFCPCYGKHYYHVCDASCREDNCPKLYHAHNHEGCTWLRYETIEYRGSRVKYFDEYFCCTDSKANDTIVYRNDMLYFCSQAKGGNLQYENNWSFSASADNSASWTGKTGDSVTFKAVESGWLRLHVSSFGQEVTDSIWIEVLRRPFRVEIQDDKNHRLDSLDICKGDEIRLYGYTEGGDGETVMQWWGDGYDAPSEHWWIFQPERTGNFIFTAQNDGIIIRDTLFIRIHERPSKPVIAGSLRRCVVPGRAESIRVEAPTDMGATYLLEYSRDGGKNFAEYARKDAVPTSGPLEFRVNVPVRDSGVYRVRVVGPGQSRVCDSYSELIEFITPPSHEEILSTSYCRDEQLTIRLRSAGDGMSYSILNNANRVMETIDSPLDFFSKPFTAGNYKIVYTHKGNYYSCSDTVGFQIKEVPAARQVDVLVNSGDGACEGMNAVVTIPLSESAVKYYLESPSGERIDLFTGTGSSVSANVGARPFGTYQVMAEQNGCSTFIDYFTFNRNPQAVVQADTQYCYPYGGMTTMVGTKLEYTRLEANVTYSLYRNGALMQSVAGPGTKSFDGLHDGSYTIIAKNDATGCMNETAFSILAKEAPKDFKLSANCVKDKNITLENSQLGYFYVLYRDGVLLNTLTGTRSPLEFGVYNTTGIYRVKGVDTLTGCSAVMNGEIIINEIGHCDLVQADPICDIRKTTALIYPCSKKGWTYYIKDVTDPNNVLRSTAMTGNDGAIRWESMGTGKLFGPHLTGRATWIPSIYVLYGVDVCGDVPLDTLSISVQSTPSGKIEANGIILTAGPVAVSTPLSVCPNGALEFFLSDVREGTRCVLVAVSSRNYKDTLVDFVATADYMTRKSIGTFGIKDREQFEFTMSNDGCDPKMIYKIVPKALPTTGLLAGKSVCEGDGVLDVKLMEKPAGVNYNYYLLREGAEHALDTILYSDVADMSFKTQTLPGRYYVVVEEVVPAAGGRYTKVCRDTMDNTFAIGDGPSRFHVASEPDNKKEIFLCSGSLGRIVLKQSEPAVDYALMRNGVEYGERQHKANGGSLTFGVYEAGEYAVRGFLGDCEVDMLDTVMVYEDVLPKLDLYDKYYFCRDAEGGARIEVAEAPMGTTFELKVNGPFSEPIERDTVRYFDDTIRFNTLCPPGDKYVMTIKTYGGCQFDHPFVVEKMAPPREFSLLLSAKAICEGECTYIGIKGDEGNVEYSLMKKGVDGDAEYNNNFIMGFGDSDSLWFPYPVCESGDYYVVATQYTRPYCESELKYENQALISLLKFDTIRECDFTQEEVHYCAGDGSSASISLENTQLGVAYVLYQGDSSMENVMGPAAIKTPAFDGETLTWTDVVSRVPCDGRGEGEYYTDYRVKAEKLSGCTKWMNGSVKVYGDGNINLLAMTQPYYEFCEGGDLKLKARAEGCGLSYDWYRVDPLGTSSVVYSGPDLLLSAATSAMSGSYYCSISNACQTLKTYPYINVNVRSNGRNTSMGDKAVCEGTSDIIYSKMSNVNEGDFAWYKKGTTKILSRNSYLQFDSITPDMQGFYVCVGGDLGFGYCNVLYDTVFVEVVKNVNKLNIEQKLDALCAGSALTLNIPATLPDGYDALWYKNGVSTTKVGLQYHKAGVVGADAGLYSIELKHRSGTVCGPSGLIPISKVRVDSVIRELWHTEDKFLCQPENIALSVRTTPATGVTYDWYRIMNGGGEEYVASGADITTQFPSGTAHAIYRVYFHNSCPSDYFSTTNVADVDVSLASNVTFKKNLPAEVSGCEGDRADMLLTVALDGVDVYDYVWIFSSASTREVDTVASGAMGVSGETSYTVPFLHDRSGFYSCVLNSSCGRIVSQSCWVRVNTPATIVEDLTINSGKMCEGSFYTPTLRAAGSDLQFRWYITYPDGNVDTVRRAIGYSWDATDQLSLMADVKYSGAKLQCAVWNSCGQALSSPVELEVVRKREIAISPAETWLCCDSTAQIEVKLLYGDGGEWSYRLRKEDYTPTGPYSVVAGVDKDTLGGLVSGKYAIVGLNDRVCDYKDAVMAEFNVFDVPRATVEFGMQSGRRDTTVCAGNELPMFVKVTGGTGPYKVAVYYQEPTMSKPEIYNMWSGSNPFLITAEEASQGYEFPVMVLNKAIYSIQVTDMTNALTGRGGCPVEVASTEVVDVRTVARLNAKMDPMGSLIFGECQLDIDLKAQLNPSPAGGTFHLVRQSPGTATSRDTIHREWAYAHILKSDGPGIYKINYSLNGVCKEVTPNSLTVVVDSLPYAHITPLDTVLCCGSASPDLRAFLHGTAPFDSLQIETFRMKDDGTTTSGKIFYTVANSPYLNNPQRLSYSMMSDCSDSLARYVATYLKDAHGCRMSSTRQAEAMVRVRKLPQMEVLGFHPAYNNGYGDGTTSVYNLNTGDSVAFKVSLISGKSPWNLSFSHLTSSPPALPDEQHTYTVSGRDTVIMLKKEGYFVFDAAEVCGCNQSGSAVMRQVLFAPPGYIKINGLFLGGALCHLLNTTPVLMGNVRMASTLPLDPSFPDYGYDPMKFAQANASPDPKNHVIDWVFVEARKQDPQTGNWSLVDRDTCLLLAGGTVVDRNFNLNLKFEGTGVVGDKFHVAVFHRNHLPVMSGIEYQFSNNGIGTPVPFGYEHNYYTKDGVVTDHAWDFWTYYGQKLMVMAPSYRQINRTDNLVSMSNAVATYLELNAASGSMMGYISGYYIWDVTLNGYVEIPAILPSFIGLPTMGSNEDAWMLYLNRDRFSEIEEF